MTSTPPKPVRGIISGGYLFHVGLKGDQEKNHPKPELDTYPHLNMTQELWTNHSATMPWCSKKTSRHLLYKDRVPFPNFPTLAMVAKH